VPDASAYVFIALGLAFGAAWGLGKQYVYLMPAGPVFLGTLACGLVAVFLLAPRRWLPLVVAAILAVVALAALFFRIDLIPAELQPYFVPLILIIVGIYLLVEPRAQ
jgi:sugar phosphate permease